MSAQVHKYEFNVRMTCGGCSSAIERVLGRNKDVTTYDVSLENQKVVVTGPISYDTVLEVIKKTGKEVISGETIE